MNIQAAIFDMDGLLIDSEPLWREVQVKIYGQHGMPVTYEMLAETMGMRIDEIVLFWLQKYNKNLGDVQAIATQVNEAAVELIVEKGIPRPGVENAFTVVKELGLRTAIASSSNTNVMDAVLEKIGVTHLVDVIHSADSEPHGKPDPAVYIGAAKSLNILPEHCVVFEDSVNGVRAAKAAKMKCVAVPDVTEQNRKEFGIADVVLHSLDEVNKNLFENITR